METELKDVLNAAEATMEKAVGYYEEQLAKIRAGRANPIMLEGLRVDYYGAATPLNQVGTVSAPDARTLVIQPFERNLIPAIEKVIKDANLGFNPQNDGIVIRITLPTLTEDRRKQLVKQVKDETESGRVAIRSIRRDTIETIKKLGKKGLPEDLAKSGETDTQKLTDAFTGKIDKLFAAKEAEVMTV